MAPLLSPLAKKLVLKEGTQALIISPPPGYLDSLAPLPEGATITHKAFGLLSFVQLFATQKSDIQKQAPALLKRAAPDAVFWITYPKKTSGVASDLSREEVWDAMRPYGWRPVTAISIDNVWSGLRFRPVEAVKSRKTSI